MKKISVCEIQNIGKLLYIFWILAITGSIYAQDSPKSEPSAGTIQFCDIPSELNPQQGNVKFGYLTVRENRSDPKNNSVIKLAFAIIKSTLTNPKPDPVLYTSGGPGVVSSVRATQYYYKIPSFVELLKERNLILFEQRGAQYAIPNLLAPEIDELLSNFLETQTNGQPEKETFIETTLKLKERFENSGIDLTAYNSIESASDIEDLRKALKLEKINYIGISYSARLMLEVFRYYPEGVRSLILDSPLPPDANWNENSVGNFWNVFEKLFYKISQHERLSQQFPDLKTKFLKLIDAANREPIEVKTQHPLNKNALTIRINGEGIFQSVASYIGTTPSLYYFAGTINGICERNSYSLKYLTDLLIAPGDFSWGMVYSFWNNEEFPFEDFNKIAFHKSLPVQLRAIQFTAAPLEIRDIWPKRIPGKVENKPVQGEVPVLILAGEYDGDTPVYYAEMIEKHLPNSRVVIFPGGTHVQIFQQDKAKFVVKEFLNNPDRKPETEGLFW